MAIAKSQMKGAEAHKKVPRHLAIIMDGNGRWAKKRFMPRKYGHRAGAENLKRVTEAAANVGISYLTVYAFSTENWKRPEDEVHALMRLFIEFLDKYDAELAKQDIRLRFQGDLKALPNEVQEAIAAADERNRKRKGMQLILAFNYGGRDEILHATKKIAEDVKAGRLSLEEINSECMQERLFLKDVPDPDMIVRTSGEMRLSNFLLWQAAYSELWVIDVLWPDFSAKHLDLAIAEYAKRERRFGGV